MRTIDNKLFLLLAWPLSCLINKISDGAEMNLNWARERGQIQRDRGLDLREELQKHS